MTATSFNPTPNRMTLMNTNTAEELEMQFNPSELDEDLVVSWAKLAVLGLSHQPQQYQYTGNHALSFDLAFRASATPTGAFPTVSAGIPDVADARRFLLSLCYASRSSTVIGGAPPRVLMTWPSSDLVGFISLTCTIQHLHFHHTLFNKAGDPIHFGCKVDIEEIRDVRLFSEDVRNAGTARAGQTAPGQPIGGANPGTRNAGEIG